MPSRLDGMASLGFVWIPYPANYPLSLVFCMFITEIFKKYN